MLKQTNIEHKVRKYRSRKSEDREFSAAKNILVTIKLTQDEKNICNFFSD